MFGLVKVAITSGGVAPAQSRTSAGAGELGMAEGYKTCHENKFLSAESRSHSG